MSTVTKPGKKKFKLTKDTSATPADMPDESLNVPTEQMISVESVKVVHNDRTEFDDDAIQTLATSIDERGLDNAITVRISVVDPVTGEFEYELIAGERRLRAVKFLQWPMIRARVMKADDRTADLLRLEENILREDLSAIDKAAGIKRYMELHGESQASVGKRFGMTQAQVSNLLRLLQLTPDWQAAVKANRVPHTVVRDVLCPWSHRPQLLDFVWNQTLSLGDDSPEIDREELTYSIRQGILELTRSVRKTEFYVHAPISPSSCYFKLDDKNRHVLDVEEMPNSEPRAWNVAAWEKLNEPAAKAYKDRQKKEREAAGGKPAKKTKGDSETVDLFKLRRAVAKQLRETLAAAINPKKHKASIVRLFVYLAGESDLAKELYGDEAYTTDPMKHVERIAGIDDAAFPGLMCDTVKAALLNEYCAEMPCALQMLASMLPIDLTHDWLPDADVLACFPDSHLVAFAHDCEIDHEQPRAALIENLLKPGLWQKGHLPAEVTEVLGAGKLS
jgi:ParB family chromosome partitioning protein